MKNNILFEDSENWKEEWINMPEFIQNKISKPYLEIKIRFKNENDVKEFSKIVNQTITLKTKSIWYPKLEIGKDANKLYVDET